MTVAGVRRFGHPDSHETNRNGRSRQLQGRGPTFSFANKTAWESYPRTLGRLLDRIFPGPVLHAIDARKGFGPGNANRIHGMGTGEIQHDPLRIVRVVLAGERLRQVRIALPIGIGCSIRHLRISIGFGAVVAREATMGKEIPVRMTDGFAGRGVAGEVSLSARVAPRALRVPMPRFDVKFRVLTIRDRLPTR